MKFTEQYKDMFGRDYSLWQKRIDVIDKYTDNRCTHILELIVNVQKHYIEYSQMFGNTSIKHMLVEFDIHNVAYEDAKLGMEFTFLNHHHSCLPNCGLGFVIERMVRELQDPFFKAREELKILGEDSKAFKIFNKEYEDILNLS